MSRPTVDNQTFIVRVVVPTLAIVVVITMVTLLIGLFDPRVDNTEVFKIIGPAFSTVIGVFSGFLGGYALAKSGFDQQGRTPTERPENDAGAQP